MTVIFQDAFTEASTDTVLASHTPTPTGTAWANEEQTGTPEIEAVAASDTATPNASSNSNRTLYSCTPAPSVDNYDVEVTFPVLAVGADSAAFLLGRFTDTSNYYGCLTYIGSAAADKKLYKNVAGTVTEIASGDNGLTASDVIRFEVRTGTQELFQNDSSIISGSDTALTSIGKAGLGVGNAFVSTDDINTLWEFDGFTVTEQVSGSGGLKLAGSGPRPGMPLAGSGGLAG